MPTPLEFLAGLSPRPLALQQAAELRPLGLYLGKGQNAIEVAVVAAAERPRAMALQAVWKARHGGRASPGVARREIQALLVCRQ